MDQIITYVAEGAAFLLCVYLFAYLRTFLKSNESLKNIEISQEVEAFIQNLAATAFKLALNKLRYIDTTDETRAVTPVDLMAVAKKELATLIDKSPNKLKSDKFDLDVELLKVADSVKIPKKI